MKPELPIIHVTAGIAELLDLGAVLLDLSALCFAAIVLGYAIVACLALLRLFCRFGSRVCACRAPGWGQALSRLLHTLHDNPWIDLGYILLGGGTIVAQVFGLK